jgi:hypothetical protein
MTHNVGSRVVSHVLLAGGVRDVTTPSTASGTPRMRPLYPNRDPTLGVIGFHHDLYRRPQHHARRLAHVPGEILLIVQECEHDLSRCLDEATCLRCVRIVHVVRSILTAALQRDSQV